MNTYKVKQEDLIGQLKGFPIEVVQRMIEEQVRQGNKAYVSVFQEDNRADSGDGGFNWFDSVDGWVFWTNVILQESFNEFFEKYPKDIEPCDFCEGQHCTALYDMDGSDVTVLKYKEMKTINIDVPEGFVIDIENSDLKAGKVVLKRIKEELDWSEFGKVSGWYISSDMELCQATLAKPDEYSKDIYPTRRLAEASLALCQLLQWRNKVWLEDGDWTPDWAKTTIKHHIYVSSGQIAISNWCNSSRILTFRTPEIRDKFLRQHRELIEKAKELL